jgi:hypothetical protein
MGQILSSGCGSYTDLDSVTASADDVLEKKIIIDKDGDPVVGTMKNIGAYDTAVSVAANSTDLYLRMHMLPIQFLGIQKFPVQTPLHLMQWEFSLWQVELILLVLLSRRLLVQVKE